MSDKCAASRLPDVVQAHLASLKSRRDASAKRMELVTTEMVEAVVRYHLDDGYSMEDLARVVGVSKQRVHQWVKAAREKV